MNNPEKNPKKMPGQSEENDERRNKPGYGQEQQKQQQPFENEKSENKNPDRNR